MTTIEVLLEDLRELADAAQTNGAVLFLTRDTQGRRASLVVKTAKRIRRGRGLAVRHPLEERRAESTQ